MTVTGSEGKPPDTSADTDNNASDNQEDNQDSNQEDPNIAELKAIIEDENSTDDEKQAARDLLAEIEAKQNE